MKQPAFYKRLTDELHSSIVLDELGASFLKLSVQPDRVVAQLSFQPLARPFDESHVLSIVDCLRSQILAVTASKPEFMNLGYSVADHARLWVFFSHDYGKGSMPLCNSLNDVIEWNISKEQLAAI
jgi:hypothetical protein